MALTKKQKEKVIRGGADILKALIRGSKKKPAKGNISGIPQTDPKKPGCGGCS